LQLKFASVNTVAGSMHIVLKNFASNLTQVHFTKKA